MRKDILDCFRFIELNNTDNQARVDKSMEEMRSINTLFNHSVELEDDIITIRLDLLEKLTNFIEKNREDLTVILPILNDPLCIFKYYLDEEYNFVKKPLDKAFASIKVNLKLKTRQLLHGYHP